MKRALICGINYIGTGNDLKGCLNDARNMEAMLRDQFAFDEIKLVLEKDATTAGIKAGLEWLIAGVSPGDVIVFHYSGHGSQLPSKLEADGYEEIICPIDLNWTTRVITDNDLRDVFNRVPNGVNTTVILDCCHSGTGLDQDAAYRPLTKEVQAITGDGSRYLEPPAGLTDDRDHVVDWHTSRDINASALLIAGCRADQTSADAFINNTYQGAATASILKAVKAQPDIEYVQLVDKMTEYMVSNGFAQRPELDGFSGLYDSKFVMPFGESIEIAPPAPAPAPVQAPTSAPSTSSNKTLIIGLALAALALLAFVMLS
jgi:hypothetical protein